MEAGCAALSRPTVLIEHVTRSAGILPANWQQDAGAPILALRLCPSDFQYAKLLGRTAHLGVRRQAATAAVAGT